MGFRRILHGRLGEEPGEDAAREIEDGPTRGTLTPVVAARLGHNPFRARPAKCGVYGAKFDRVSLVFTIIA